MIYVYLDLNSHYINSGDKIDMYYLKYTLFYLKYDVGVYAINDIEANQ